MPPMSSAVWLAFRFSIALGVIVMVANIGIYALGGPSNSAILVYLSFLPMAFYLAAAQQQALVNHVQTLEERIKVLEAGKTSE